MDATHADYPKSPNPVQRQDTVPGREGPMNPRPDHGEQTYRGAGRLAGKKTVITGADSGIGRAVAVAFAREGADVLIAYLDEDEDARETAEWVEQAGQKVDKPRPTLLPYAAIKAAIQNFTASLAQLFGDRGIRVNCVAPGPIWTPLIPSSMPEDHVKSFGTSSPMRRPGQPAELAPVYVLLASNDASYVSGATVPVTGGTPMI